ncbi:MAG: hypothetical protein JHD16_00755 [Solirubrobacteraceae bacterium]|nr:hypothetical protein [Solirubrobacteraceae bacterium]
MKRRHVITLALLAAGVTATPAIADVVPRDGAWGGTITSEACDPAQGGCAPTEELGFFKLRARTVSALSYTVLVACYNRETRETYDRAFTGGKRFPSGQRVPTNLRLVETYDESSDGRSGSATTTLDFRGSRAKLTVRLSVGGSIERCTGRTTIPLRRGPLR